MKKFCFFYCMNAQTLKNDQDAKKKSIDKKSHSSYKSFEKKIIFYYTKIKFEVNVATFQSNEISYLFIVFL